MIDMKIFEIIRKQLAEAEEKGFTHHYFFMSEKTYQELQAESFDISDFDVTVITSSVIDYRNIIITSEEPKEKVFNIKLV